MLNEPIDIYCERIDTSFWAEPVNAISSIAFIVASIMAFRLYTEEKLKSYSFIFLSFLVFLMGLISFLVHTFANSLSLLAENILFWSFVVFYMMISIRDIFYSSWFKMVLLISIIVAIIYIEFTRGIISFSENLQYAPILFLLGVFFFMLYLRRVELSRYGFYTLVLFFISLTFKNLDTELCTNLSIGTHFIWQILNAVVFYYLLLIILKAQVKNESLYS